MDLNKTCYCSLCGNDGMKLRVPIWITPGEEAIDTGDIDWYSDNETTWSNWWCDTCQEHNFPINNDKKGLSVCNVHVITIGKDGQRYYRTIDNTWSCDKSKASCHTGHLNDFKWVARLNKENIFLGHNNDELFYRFDFEGDTNV